MKKILYVTTISNTINSFLIPHILALKKEGNIVDCACNIVSPLDRELIEHEVKVYNIELQRRPLKYKNFKAFFQILKIIKQGKYEIIHVHTPIASAVTRLVKIFYPPVKIIYTAHGFHFHENGNKLFNLIFIFIEKFLGRLTDILITINEYDYRKAVKYKFLKKIENIFLVYGVGIDLDYYNPERFHTDYKVNKKKSLNLLENDFVITMIAEFNKNKRQIDLIKAIEVIKEENTEIYKKIKILLIGDGQLFAHITNLIHEKGLENEIYCLGQRNDIVELLSISNLNVLISEREGLSRSVMEALAMNVPVIGTNIRGIRDLITTNYRLIEVGDYIRLKEGICDIFLNHPESLQEDYRKQMSIMSVEKIVNRLLEIYKESI